MLSATIRSPYFTDVAGSTEKYNIVPFAQLASDIANHTLPNYGFITPNIEDDAHGTLTAADNWLQTNIAPLIASPEFQQDGILIITFDESFDSDCRPATFCPALPENVGGGRVATLVIGPHVKPGYRSTTFYQHPSVLKTVGKALGLTSVPGAAQEAPDMGEFFGGTANTTATASPIVNILSPTAGSSVSSPVTVNATFTNGGTPQYMKLWVDGIASYYNNNSTSLSYSVSLVTGAHQIVVQAYNGTLYTNSENITVGTTITPVGPTTSSTGQCSLSTVSPSVTIYSPTNNSTVGTSVAVQAGSTDTGSTVWLMQVYVDGFKQYEVQSNAVNTTMNLTAGTHRLTVQALTRPDLSSSPPST